METTEQKRERAAEITRRLRNEYVRPQTALVHENALQLLIATILSAQCTDVRVNLVTPGLFQKYPDVHSLAAAPIEELEEKIRSTGFYHNKARSISLCCQAIIERFGGEVPREMEELVTLAGVGRKTANCVRGAVFGLPAITVDTHVGRLSRRLGFTNHLDPEKVEQELQSLIPEESWYPLSNALIYHGREVCHSRKPNCPACLLVDVCPSREIKATANNVPLEVRSP